MVGQDQKGFSLAELMVTIGIVGGLSVFIMDMIQSIRDSERASMSFFEVSTATLNIMEALQDEATCTRTFEGLNPSGLFPAGAAVNSISVAGARGTGTAPLISDKYTVGEIFNRGQRDANEAAGAGAFQIEDMQVSNYGNSSDPLYPASSRQAFLTVTFRIGAAIGVDLSTLDPAALGKLRQRVGGAPQIVRRIPIQVDLDGAGLIQRCNSGGAWITFLEEACENYFQGALNTDLMCVNMVVSNLDGTTSRPQLADSMLTADGEMNVADAFKTESLKVQPNPANHAINPDTSLSVTNQLWSNSLGLGGHDSTTAGLVSTPGTVYIGNNPIGTLGTPGNPEGIDIDGTIRVIGNAWLDDFPQTVPVTDNIDDRAYVATARWVAARLAGTLGGTGTLKNATQIANDILSNDATARLEASHVIRHYICQNTRIRSFDSPNTLNMSPTQWVYGSYNAGTGQCTFDVNVKKNCAAAGNCQRIYPENALCINNVCKTRWPFIRMTGTCTWKTSCGVNERPQKRRDTTPSAEYFCCTWVYED